MTVQVAVLVGLVVTWAFGWWWADSIAALILLAFIVPEAREAIE
jgi:divalent metal cation (Fe/Co/Zn/Cd) transporter